MIRVRSIWFGAVVLFTVVLGVTATPAHSSSPGSEPAANALAHAKVIRAEVTARYRNARGRKLVVTEVTATGVVESITLISDWLEPERVVPAQNGIYFAICSSHAKCPYPARSAVWPIEAFLPRRMALELALRTLVETSASLVVVALPTARPAWVVVERDLLVSGDAQAMLDRLTSNPDVTDSTLRELVDRITEPRLFLPLPILPPPDHTIYALALSLTNP
jgi:hypothetical protein